jgi:hypothetical protein
MCPASNRILTAAGGEYMIELKSVLVQFKNTLPSAEDVTVDNLHELQWAIEEILGFGGKVITLDDGSSKILPADMKAFFDALVYFQCISSLFSTICCDGLLSVFYNDTGAEIEQTQRTLIVFGDPIAPLFEKAYQMLRIPYDIQPDTNWVTLNDCDPFDTIGEDTLNAVNDIESQIEGLNAQAWARALAIYQAAR